MDHTKNLPIQADRWWKKLSSFFKNFLLFRIKSFIEDPFWINFCIWCNSFACEHPAVPAPFVEMMIFFLTELYWHPCWKSTGHKCEDLFLDSQFCSIGLMSILMPVQRPDYCYFAESFDTQKCEFSNFFLLSESCFGYSEFLKFP